MKSASIIGAAFCFLLAISAAAMAETGLVFETANGSYNRSLYTGFSVGAGFWRSHRFQLDEPTRITEVGGFFERINSGSSVTLFAAISTLSGPEDFPDSVDLSTDDFVASTTLLIPGNSDGHDVTGVFDNLVLSPGWYALTFGAGKFGSSSSSTSAASMISLSNDVAIDQLPFTLNRFGAPPFFYTAISPRFFSLGYTVPECSGLVFVVTGAVVLAAGRSARRRISIKCRSRRC